MSSSAASNLFALARSKLNPPSPETGRDRFSLHRFVLLKNSILHSLPLSAPPSDAPPASTSSAEDLEYVDDSEETDSFMFPDGSLLADDPPAESGSEAAWLDSLLQTLGEDEDYDETDPDADADVELLPSPPISPISSTEDLSIYPYLVPYPPYSPPLISLPPGSSTSCPYAVPLPYADFEDDPDLLPVPDAIEDGGSDDDSSDTPTTPGQSLSSLSLEPAFIPLPADHSRLRFSSTPAIFDPQDSLDALPFLNTYRITIDYPQC